MKDIGELDAELSVAIDIEGPSIRPTGETGFWGTIWDIFEVFAPY